jgi:hypothetical protein
MGWIDILIKNLERGRYYAQFVFIACVDLEASLDISHFSFMIPL